MLSLKNVELLNAELNWSNRVLEKLLVLQYYLRADFWVLVFEYIRIQQYSYLYCTRIFWR